MELKFITMLLLLFLSFLLYVYFICGGKKYSGRLPPGSLGLPLIGQNFGFLKAFRADKLEEWFKHGPVSKANLFGHPTVILYGPSANKFVFTLEDGLINTQAPSIRRIFGRKNIMELMGDDHKRVRAALVSFLKIEVLKRYVAKVDQEIKHHLETHWHAKKEVQVQPLMKRLTFNVICSLLFGIERGPKREQLLPLFQDIFDTMLAISINLPFTQYNRGLKSRKKLVTLLVDLLHEKKEALKEQKQQVNHDKNLITSLLNLRDEDGSRMMSDEEIIDNIIFVMAAGYDTTSVLLTFFMRLLANNESIYSNVAQEHEEISKSKAPGEVLTWEDLTRMNYTWKVASEVLRIYPPVNITLR